MKFKTILSVNSNEMYDFLMDNLKKELNVDYEIKENMKFEKTLYNKMNKEVKTMCEVIKLVKNKEYTLKYTSTYGTHLVCYNLKDIGNNKVEIEIEEKYISNNFFQNLNNAFMELIFYYFITIKKRKMFKEIERYILNNNQ